MIGRLLDNLRDMEDVAHVMIWMVDMVLIGQTR